MMYYFNFISKNDLLLIVGVFILFLILVYYVIQIILLIRNYNDVSRSNLEYINEYKRKLLEEQSEAMIEGIDSDLIDSDNEELSEDICKISDI